MTDKQIDRLELTEGVRAINSNTYGLVYFVADADPRVAIGAKGVCILTRAQAEALVEELSDVLALHGGVAS